MLRRSPVLVLACLGLVATWACGPQPDLKTLKVIPGISGFIDGGYVPVGQPYAGQARLLPSITFQLKNEGTLPLEYVDLTVAFWRANDDGEKDSKLIHAIGKDGLAPGATTDTLTVQSTVGYTSPTAPAEFFSSSYFIDFKVKIFARRAGSNASLGEFVLERRILPVPRKDGLHQ